MLAAAAQPPGGGGHVGHRGHYRPHRAGAVLALGIIGLPVCIICGIIAWVMGSGDLRDMRAGRMDPSGYGMTQAGMVCGMVGTILAIVGLLFACLIFGMQAAAFG